MRCGHGADFARGFCTGLDGGANGIGRREIGKEGRDAAARRLGAEEAHHLVDTRPQAILDDMPPAAVPPLPDVARPGPRKPGLWQRLFGSP